MLNLFLPMVYISNQNNPENSVYYNLQNMEYSNNENILKVSEHLELINVLLWAIIVISILSFFGRMLKLSKKLKLLGDLFLVCGCSITFLSILSFYYYHALLNIVAANENLSIAYLSDKVQYFSYPYIILLFLVLLMVSCFYYFFVVLIFFTKKIKNKKEKSVDKEKPSEESQWAKKRESTEEWKPDEIEKIDDLKEDAKKDEKPEFITSREEKREKPVLELKFDEEAKASPFSDETEAELSKPDIEDDALEEDPKFSETFEKALYSAIEKHSPLSKDQKKTKGKKTKGKKDVKNKKEEKKSDVASSEFNVKCPQCTHVFKAQKNVEGITKIKCPECGKEGVIK
jgi:hypothetical protein